MGKELLRYTRGLLAAVALAAMPAVAQAQVVTPTPEGTTITNTATATWQDANGNPYTASDDVSVTVGFKAAISVNSDATGTPNSGSTGNELNFTVTNGGNGIDSVEVSFDIPTGITATGYKVGATTYATLAELNDALGETHTIDAGSSITVTLVYSVASGTGGQDLSVSMTATSDRDPTNESTDTTVLTPPVVGGVAVALTDNSHATLNRVPGDYTETFTITNTGSARASFTVAAASNASAVVVINSVTKVGGAALSDDTVSIAGGSASLDVVVNYTVKTTADAAAQGTITLTATKTDDATISDDATSTVTTERPNLVVTKQAFLDDQATQVSGTVQPGDVIYYKVTVQNNGNAAAEDVSVEDILPAEVTYGSASTDVSTDAWSFTVADATIEGNDTKKVTAALGSSVTIAAGASRFFWISVTIK